MSKKRVAVIGCAGKMGTVVCRHLLGSSGYQLACGIDISHVGDDLGQVIGTGILGITISSNIQTALAGAEVDIAIEFSTPKAVVNNVAQCLQAKVGVLVGTTGISNEDVTKLELLSEKVKVPVLIVPNFALGALLMMEFAKKAAKYLPDAEIIEMHHPQKLDKPSGTAIKTRNGILESLENADVENPLTVPIHSVRLPGLLAHQMVIFGGVGQCLTIRHDSFNRESFMPGIDLGLKQLQETKGVRIGLSLQQTEPISGSFASGPG